MTKRPEDGGRGDDRDSAAMTATPLAGPGGVRELRLALTVDDIDVALAAYRDVLGMSVVASWDHPSGRGVVLAADRATLELLEPSHAAYVDDIEVGRPIGGSVRIALHVNDSEAAAAGLTESGAERLGPAVVTPWNQLNARLRTTEGVQLTLYSEIDDQPKTPESMPERG